MKNILRVIVVSLISTFALSWPAEAQLAQGQVRPAEVRLGDIAYAGDGCPVGSLHVERGEIHLEKLTLSLKSNQTKDRKACAIAVPYEVQQGYQVGLVAPDIQGRARLSNTGKLQLSAEVFFAGQRGVILSQEIKGRRNAIYQVRGKNQVIWSRCGSAGILRIQAAALLTDKASARPLATVDILRADRGSLLVVRACE